MSQKLFSDRVYATCCWALLAISVLLAVSSHVVLIDGVELSIGGVSLPMKFVSAKMFMRVLASLCWCLIFIVGRWHEKYANKDFLPIGFCIGSLGVLIWRYPDIVSGTAYQDVSRCWFVALLILGYMSGMVISEFICWRSFLRAEKESTETGLPRNSILARVTLKIAIVISIIPVIGMALFISFYNGPLLMPIFWFVSFAIFSIQGENKALVSQFKKYSDWAEYGAFLNLSRSLLLDAKKEEMLLRLPPRQIQIERAKEMKERYMQCLEAGEILSCATIKQCGEQIVRIEWRTREGKICEYHLNSKQAYKYWDAYQWLCLNDEYFFKYNFSEKTALLYAMQDHLLEKKGCALLEWRINVQDEADLEIIIKATSSINVRKPPGWTLLLFATANGFLEGVRLLLKYGANTELSNVNGVTPVLYAVRYDNVECLKLLIEAGAKVCVEDNRGYTALMIAAEHNCKSVVPALLKEGVNPKKRTCSGRTALDIALASQAGDIADMLRNRIKEIDSSKGRMHKRKKR